MSRESTSEPDETGATCTRHDCELAAQLWLYHPMDDQWRPFCERHTRHRHPSLEINAWLESGYAKPIELGTPDEPPATPHHGRAVAFRKIVDQAMGWSQ